MKRLICFALAMTLIIGVSLMPSDSVSKPNEGLGYYVEYHFNSATNQLIIPGFRAEKMDLVVTGTDSIAITMYIPANLGPLTATDSFTVIAIAPRLYYGPTSDTMRVAVDGRSTVSCGK